MELLCGCLCVPWLSEPRAACAQIALDIVLPLAAAGFLCVFASVRFTTARFGLVRFTVQPISISAPCPAAIGIAYPADSFIFHYAASLPVLLLIFFLWSGVSVLLAPFCDFRYTSSRSQQAGSQFQRRRSRSNCSRTRLLCIVIINFSFISLGLPCHATPCQSQSVRPSHAQVRLNMRVLLL